MPTAHLPAPVLEGVEAALARLGRPSRVQAVTPVTGGCINHGARVDTDRSESYFLKWNAAAPPRMFEMEAEGLRALSERAALKVPEPVARGGGSGSPSWFLMEYIAAGRPAADYDAALGAGLAAVHTAADSSTFGWHRNNWIGSLPQSNRASSSWVKFWSDERIAPQLKRATDRGHFDPDQRRLLERVTLSIPEALADVDTATPQLLHGDLWGGNAYAASDGRPVIIDPAVYRGHGEVDLAMTELFGGFGPAFYAAYADAGGISDAYTAYRRDLYQLYYLLVHVNLFGAQYVRRSISAARRIVGALG